MSQEIVIVDYDMGNIRSILNKLERAGKNAVISDDKNVIKNAKKLILPGVGHFQTGMKKLNEKGILEALNEKVLLKKTPILGICLGMQLFSNFSEEGNARGLGWIDAETVLFDLNDIRHKVPHIGWNTLTKKKDSILFRDIPDEASFYFVHSYHIKCNEKDDVLATTQYGYDFISAVERENLFGTQFHPEKSHECGERLIKNFLQL